MKPVDSNVTRSTPGNEALAPPEGQRGNRGEPARPLTNESAQFGALAPRAANLRSPGGLTANEVRPRSPLPTKPGTVSSPKGSSSTPAEVAAAGGQPARATYLPHLPLETQEKIIPAVGDELHRKVEVANTFISEMLNGGMTGNALGRAISHIGPMMESLTQDNLQRLVDAATTIKEPIGLAFAIKGLVSGMDCLSKPQQRSVFMAALKAPKGSDGRALAEVGPVAGLAIDCLSEREHRQLFSVATSRKSGDIAGRLLAGWVPAMAHCNETQQENLIKNATGLAETGMGSALGSLGAVMAHLSEARRERVIAAAIGIQDHRQKAPALAGLAAGVAHLSDPQREIVIDAAIDLACMDVANRRVPEASALQSLIAEMAHLSETQREKIITATLGLVEQDDAHVQAHLLAHLGVQSAHFNDSQCERIASYANGIHQADARAIALSGMAHFSETHFQSFVASLSSIEDRVRGAALGCAGPVMAHLSEAQRDQLVDAAAGIRNDDSRGSALKELRAGMAHLNEPQRDRIVAAIAEIGNDEVRGATITGLGAAAACWSEPQRGRLMALVEGSIYDKDSIKAATLAELRAGMFAKREPQ